MAGGGVDLVVDCREHAVLELLQSRGREVTRRQLDVGDFHVLVDGETVVCAERKSYPDMLSSISDGRFREQRDRMRCTIGAGKMLYLLEGFPERHEFWDAGALTATLHMQHRDGIRVARTADPEDTLRYMDALVARVAKEPQRYTTSVTGGGGGGGGAGVVTDAEYQANLHASQVCRKKGGNLSSSSVFRLMLSSVPGVSGKIAANIEAKVAAGGFATLMRDLLSCATQAERLAYFTSIDKVGAIKAKLILACLGFVEQ